MYDTMYSAPSHVSNNSTAVSRSFFLKQFQANMPFVSQSLFDWRRACLPETVSKQNFVTLLWNCWKRGRELSTSCRTSLFNQMSFNLPSARKIVLNMPYWSLQNFQLQSQTDPLVKTVWKICREVGKKMHHDQSCLVALISIQSYTDNWLFLKIPYFLRFFSRIDLKNRELKKAKTWHNCSILPCSSYF